MTGFSKRDVRIRMSGSGDRSGDRGRPKARLRERSWDRMHYPGIFSCCQLMTSSTESWHFVGLYAELMPTRFMQCRNIICVENPCV